MVFIHHITHLAKFWHWLMRILDSWTGRRIQDYIIDCACDTCTVPYLILGTVQVQSVQYVLERTPVASRVLSSLRAPSVRFALERKWAWTRSGSLSMRANLPEIRSSRKRRPSWPSLWIPRRRLHTWHVAVMQPLCFRLSDSKANFRLWFVWVWNSFRIHDSWVRT